jgi:hypothetical protein
MIMGFSNLETVDSALVELVTFYHPEERIGMRMKDGRFVAVENATGEDRAVLERNYLHIFERDSPKGGLANFEPSDVPSKDG